MDVVVWKVVATVATFGSVFLLVESVYLAVWGQGEW
jgi:hypothetical protein